MVVIVDYKMGNIGSVLNMLKKIGAAAKISSDIDDLLAAEKLILPGVGAFDTGMTNIEQMGLLPVLNHKVLKEKTPILGICLGIQLFTCNSEEGVLPGLGWIAGETIRFRFQEGLENLKIPHMGWNTVRPSRSHPIFQGILEDEDAAFYFVHSYHLVCDHEEDVLTMTNHGYDFVSSIQRDNIMGTQFHPEKSHQYGLKLLRNFVDLN